ncbi:STY0301 family protein [Noviherbaspirillum cavernae]|uniref:STY0301 family protein n=1 Tax=Noviherbaspirillum cavernae TaxID=2320862 RepID=UPI0011C4919A|nr:STY0301 family protein [Noviherbaspirillum cavernae]
MTCKPAFFVLFYSLLFPAASFGATNLKNVCPARIETSQSPRKIPEGWTPVLEGGPSILTNAGFYDGHPEQLAELAPSKSKSTRRELVNDWSFSTAHNGSIWIKCIYSNTGLSLARQLDKDISSCSISYDARHAPFSIADITCK